MSDDSDKESLKNPEVEVRVEPKYDKTDPDFSRCDRAADHIKERVEKAIEKTDGEGVEKQLGAAVREVDEASKRVDPDGTDNIHVEIDDEEGGWHVQIDKAPSGDKS